VFARLKRIPWGPLLVAITAAALGWFLDQFAFGAGVCNISYDLLHVSRGNIPLSEVAIVYIDEQSHRDLAQPLNEPWSRAVHAELIDRLTKTGVKAIVMDIVFSDANPAKADADQRLIEAVRRNGHVALGADHIRSAEGVREYIRPFEALRDVAAAYGSVEMLPSRDLIVRAHAPNEILPSMSWEAAKLCGTPITKTDPEEFQPSPDIKGATIRSWINYYGPPGWVPGVSYADALLAERTPDSLFSNKVVFIGSRVITKLQNERNDAYRNPYSFWITKPHQSPLIAGVEVQATMFLNLLRGDWLRRFPEAIEVAIIIGIGALAGFFLMRMKPGVAIFTAIALLAAVGFASRWMFMHQLIWFPWLIVFIQIFAALLCSVAINSVRLYVENKMFVQSLEMYLSPKLVKKFAADHDRKLLQPGAVKQKLTILFSDIAEFTAISEGMDSDELAKTMNTYFQHAVADCIHATDGTVVKYIGDAIFAFWNAPDPQQDHAARACAAALRFRDLGRQSMNGKQLITRLGLHTGVANVGNFGSATRVDYTAIGESINLASRMEGLNKYLGTDVLITGETKKEIGDSFVTRHLGRFQLKGFEKSVAVYELLATGDQEKNFCGLRDSFEQAVYAFQGGDIQHAETSFRRVLELFPNDGATRFYLAIIDELKRKPLPENWDGTVQMQEK
jgi:adenylate cyclase